MVEQIIITIGHFNSMKQHISRNGSECVIRDSKGKLWLTRRQKSKHDSKRRKRKSRSVIHLPIRRIMEKGDWLFTCSINPEQFSHWRDDDMDMFVTLNGANHSKKNCSLSPISDEYAEFFIKHNLSELYEINYNDFDKYALAVRKVCDAFKIKFEGIWKIIE